MTRVLAASCQIAVDPNLAGLVLALGDGHLQPHVVALLLGVLRLGLLPAHSQRQLELELLLSVCLRPANISGQTWEDLVLSAGPPLSLKQSSQLILSSTLPV